MSNCGDCFYAEEGNPSQPGDIWCRHKSGFRNIENPCKDFRPKKDIWNKLSDEQQWFTAIRDDVRNDKDFRDAKTDSGQNDSWPNAPKWFKNIAKRGKDEKSKIMSDRVENFIKWQAENIDKWWEPAEPDENPLGLDKKQDVPEADFANISHPNHYTWIPGIECNDVAGNFSFNIGSALKYLWRHGRKGDAIQDLRKAIQFIEFEIQRLKEPKNESDQKRP